MALGQSSFEVDLFSPEIVRGVHGSSAQGTTQSL